MNKNYVALSLFISIFAFTNCFGMDWIKGKFRSENVALENQTEDFFEDCSICQDSLNTQQDLIQPLGCACSKPLAYHEECWTGLVNHRRNHGEELICLLCRSLVEQVEKVSLMSEGRRLDSLELNLQLQENFSKYQYKKIEEFKKQEQADKGTIQELKKQIETGKNTIQQANDAALRLEMQWKKFKELENENQAKKPKREQKKNSYLNRFKDIVHPALYGFAFGVILTSLFPSNYPDPWQDVANWTGLSLELSAASDMYKKQKSFVDKKSYVFYNKALPKLGLAGGIMLSYFIYHYCNGYSFNFNAY